MSVGRRAALAGTGESLFQLGIQRRFPFIKERLVGVDFKDPQNAVHIGHTAIFNLFHQKQRGTDGPVGGASCVRHMGIIRAYIRYEAFLGQVQIEPFQKAEGQDGIFGAFVQNRIFPAINDNIMAEQLRIVFEEGDGIDPVLQTEDTGPADIFCERLAGRVADGPKLIPSRRWPQQVHGLEPTHISSNS